MRIRSAVAGCAALAGLAACGPYPSPAGGPSGGGYGTVSAHLIPSGIGSAIPGFNIDVSDDAYAAVFRVIPGAGTYLVYPRPGYGSMDGYVRSGLNWFEPRGLRFSDRSFADFPLGPEFYLLIASEEPLRLDQFGPFGDNLQHVLGVGYRSTSGYAAE